MGHNFPLVGVRHVLHAFDDSRLEGVTLFHEFVHALRIRTRHVRQSLQRTRLPARPRPQPLRLKIHGIVNFAQPARTNPSLFHRLLRRCFRSRPACRPRNQRLLGRNSFFRNEGFRSRLFRRCIFRRGLFRTLRRNRLLRRFFWSRLFRSRFLLHNLLRSFLCHFFLARFFG